MVLNDEVNFDEKSTARIGSVELFVRQASIRVEHVD